MIFAAVSKRGWLWVGLAIILQLQIFWGVPAQAEEKTPQVVILNSYHQGFKWSDKLQAGLLDKLGQDFPGMAPAIEYLDAKRFPGETQRVRLSKYLAEKYRNRKIDLVIVLDNSALELALQFRQEIWPGAPLVFAGINDFKPAMLAGQDRVTGVAEVHDLRGTLELALALHPRTEEILVIHDYTDTGLALRREMEAILPAFKERVKISFTPPATFEEIQNQQKSLPANSLALLFTFITDRQGMSLSVEESTRLFTDSAVPTYALTESRLDHGIVGGVLLGGWEHGRRAGEIAVRVLTGEDPAQIPVVTESTAKPLFDYNQLIRFAVPLEALPKGSVIINRPATFYAQNTRLIWAISAVILAMSLVIFGLTMHILYRRRAEKALQERDTKLRSIFACTGEAMLTVDNNHTITSINPAFARLSGYAEEETVGQSVALIHSSQEHFRKFREMVSSALAATGSWQGEWEIKQKDGALILTEMTMTSLYSSDGTLGGFVGTLRDITERRRMEQALRESESRLRSLYEAVQAGILVVRADGNIIHANRVACDNLGMEIDEITGKTSTDGVWQMVFEDGSPVPSEEYPSMITIRTGQPIRNAVRGIFAKNQEKMRWLLVNTEPIWDPNKERLLEVTITFQDITEIKKTEQALRESEEKYRLVFENAPLGILHYDQNGIVTDLNEAFATIVGAPKERIIGFNMPQQIRDEKMRQAVEASLTGQAGYYEGEYLSVTGGLKRNLRAFFRGVFSETGEFHGGVCIFEDYTERHQAEQKQQEYFNFLQILMDAIPNPVFYKDTRGIYLGCNKACEESWGRSKEDLIGKSVFDLHPPDLAAIYHARDMELLDHPGVQFYETSMAHADGPRKEVILHNATFYNLDGTLGGLIGVEMNITERKRAEEALRESEESLRQILEVLPLAVWVADENGVIVQTNPAGQQIWAGAKYVGLEQYGEYKGWWRETGKLIKGEEWALARAIQKGETSLNEVIEIECFDGTRKVILNSALPLKNARGEIVRAIVVNQDITERIQFEERLKTSLREKEVLLKEIHHRVKNNLQIIATLLSLQLRYDRTQDPAEMFQDCQNRIRSMALIHESLYSAEDLANINFRQYLEKLTSRLLTSYGSSAQGIKITVDGNDVYLDISQAVPCGLIANELVVNSLKHAFKGRQKGEVQVTIEDAADQRILEVRDNGLGLAPDFDLENPSTFGWMMVKNLAKQLGGNFRVESVSGTSCRVVFS